MVRDIVHIVNKESDGVLCQIKDARELLFSTWLTAEGKWDFSEPTCNVCRLMYFANPMSALHHEPDIKLIEEK